MRQAINNIVNNLQSYAVQFVERPLDLGIRLSYFILQAGCAAWLILFTMNFVKHMLGI